MIKWTLQATVVSFAAVTLTAFGGEEPYLQSDGSQSVVTDFYPGPRTKAVADLVFLREAEDANNHGYAFGVRGRDPYNRGLLDACFAMSRNSASNVYYAASDEDSLRWCGSARLDHNVRATLTLDGPNDRASWSAENGTSASIAISGSGKPHTKRVNVPMSVFSCFDAAGAFNGTSIRLYSLKLYEDGVLVRDYVPAKSGTVAGLYDTVNRRFLAPRGGALVIGGAYTEVTDEAYLESDGSQFVVTDYYANPASRAVADCSFNQAASNWEYVFGALGASTTLKEQLKFGFSMARNKSDNLYYAGSDNCKILWCGNRVIGVNARILMMLDCVLRRGWWSAPEGAVAQTNFTDEMGECTQTATSPIALFAANDASSAHDKSSIRFYSAQVYERGEIQRDFVPAKRGNVPGVYDKVNGKFFTPEGGWLVAGGSPLELPNDAYLESDGTQAIVTDYYANDKTKMSIDFEFPAAASENAESIVSARGTWESAATAINFNFGLERRSDGKLYYARSNDKGIVWLGDYIPESNRRLTVTLDSPASTWMRKEVCSNAVSKAITPTGTGTANYPMVVFGNNNAGTIAGKYPLRIYSVKFWEDGSLVRHYVPYRNGTTIGLYDLVTGKVALNAVASGHAFTIGGMGTDESGVALKVAPKDARARRTQPQKFFAFAPGAVTYRWFREGVEIAGATGPEVALAWNGVGGVETIGVKPVYELNGKTYEGELATCKFDNNIQGAILVVR